MSNFVKIYGSIIQSTVWQQPKEVKLVWLTMLILADAEGRVEASIPGLASTAGVSVGEVEQALATFLAPDKYSRTKANGGRKIAEIEGGWLVLNHSLYRDLRTRAQVKNTERQQRFQKSVLKARADQATARAAPAERDARYRRAGDVSDVKLNGRHTPSRADPDPDPDLNPKGLSISCTADVQHTPAGRTEVEHPTIPARSYVVPDAWQPLERHAARCIDLGLDLDEQVANYRTFEFERPLSDWNRRFDRWLTDGRKRAETEAFKRQQAARGGARRTVNGVAQLQPDGGLTGFEAVDRDD